MSGLKNNKNIDKPDNYEKKKSGKNDKHKEYENFENFEDFNDFVKATGWKAQSKVNQKKNNSITLGSNTAMRSSAYNRKLQPDKHTGKKADNKWTDIKKTDIKKTDSKKRYEKTDIRKTGSYISDHKNEFKEHENQPNKLKVCIPKGSCPHMKECGGCNILRESYQIHLSEKQKEVEKLLKKYCRIEPIIGMEKPEYYRNKVHVVFDHDRKGNPISGVYEAGTHRVVPVEKCRIHNEKADAIIATIRGLLKSFKILTYDEDTGYGLLRHVLIRTGYHSGEILVVIVLASPILPSKNNFVKALLKVHPEITSVVVNVNDKKTSMVLGEKEQVIYGKGYIEDTLCGKIFRISPKSFYQVNPRQTEVLYHKAIELAKLTGEETVVDAYCGIGTIGLIASEHVKKVIGVELNKDAVRDAVTNAKRNKTENIEFYQNDAGVFLSQMAATGDSIDVVIMDPPRTGSTNQFLDAINTIRPKTVVYISCNPETLARDLEYLTKKGYKAEIAIPVDMFPWTRHVETVALLTRKNVLDYNVKIEISL